MVRIWIASEARVRNAQRYRTTRYLSLRWISDSLPDGVRRDIRTMRIYAFLDLLADGES